jgi:uncharacterized OB-fold protein
MKKASQVRTEVPAPYKVGGALLPGWYTLDQGAPHLLGARCKTCGTYYFPKMITFCRNPACSGDSFEEVQLSRSGTLWSWTNACYAPPEPFVAAEPYQPFAIAAVELEKEKMIVLGACTKGVTVEQLKSGMKMELALEPLTDGKLSWKWAPAKRTS